MIWVSPAEPAPLRQHNEFKTSPLPEFYGCDFLWPVEDLGLCGVQRKEVVDFLASIRDGRLARELAQLQFVNHPMLIIEGKLRWTTTGELLTSYGERWTKAQLQGYIWSIQARGILTTYTESSTETVDSVFMYYRWTSKLKHASTFVRPKPTTPWGKPTNREYQVHLLQGLPGVGVELANRLIDAFGGTIPFGWRITEAELLKVEGIGKVKARAIYGALDVL